ncbi:MAG: sulfotransferase, partial [Pseudomonadota bacterium]
LADEAREAAAFAVGSTELHAAAAPALVGLALDEGEAPAAEAAAREALDAALAIDPEDEAAMMALAAVHTDQGNEEAAVHAYRAVVAARPGAGQAWYGLSLQDGPGLVAEDLARIRDALSEAPDLASADRIGLNFALARAADAAGDVDTAFRHFATGNAVKREERPFDADGEERNADAIVSAFTPAVFEQFQGSGNDSPTPVLIVGMPRSGSTLIEQILSAHPEVAAAGETNALWRTLSTLSQHLPRGARLPNDIARVPASAWASLAEAYLERLKSDAGAAARITDKLPFNYTLLGMLRLMLPNATIIDARRHPMDTCWSCFTTSFGNERGFTTDLTDLGRTYKTYDRLMAHWQKVLPGACHTAQYEDLIDDTEAQIRALLDATGLDWHDDCLAFFNNPRAVTTASYAQVRRPIYTTSVGRWRPYETHLAPLRAALGSLADRD